MKKFSVIMISLVLAMFSFVFVGCSFGNNESIVRIHIRANSNNESDQSVKLLVRDSVVKFIQSKINNCDSSDEVLATLEDNLKNIESIADEVLLSNGFEYTSSATIDYEYFPSRDYDGITFPSDYYNALILRLGSGTGDNWWCVAYPPLCFVGEDTPSEEIEYKSKILEIINNYF